MMRMNIVFSTAGVSLLVLTGTGLGEIIGSPITVTATSQLGTSSFSISVADGTYDPDTGNYFYSQQGSRTLMDDSGRTIAVVDGLTLFVQGDPLVSLGFAVQAGQFPTSFSITSGINSFASILNPTASSSAGMTLTDANGNNGATLIGDNSGFGYQTMYNGASIYSNHVPSFVVGPGDTQTNNGNTNVPIAGSVSGMSASFNFTLSSFDSASGTGNFNIVPAPSALLALAAGALGLRRRR
jgi:hypothetical protein